VSEPRERRRGRARGLFAGLTALGALALVALAAPRVATDRPWLARGEDGWSAPAWTGGDADGATTVIPAPVPHAPDAIRLEDALEPPSARHWLGTDSLGRDVLARMVHGTRVSFAVGLLSAVLALAIGAPLGLVAGYARGLADAAVSRVVEAVLCFPTLVLLLALLSARPPWLAGVGDVTRISIVLAAVGWVPVTRYLRAEVLRVAASDAVAAARGLGASPWRIVVRHVLPASLAPVLVTASFAVASAVVVEATLSFLGLGVAPPRATWGGLLADAREHVGTAWWLVAFPGSALFVTLLACNLVGEGLRDALDPRSRPG